MADAVAITTFGKPERVDAEKRLISGFAVITRGEALGHDLWIDDVFLSQVAQAARAKGSLKSRFTHPGFLSDGLGRVLGRAEEFRCAEGKVQADLRVLKAADKSPEGALGAYVLDLAKEAPDFFGASIVFSRDRDAESTFVTSNERDDEDGSTKFVSPDPQNTKNLRHARLAALHAVDVVDDPAANAEGLFTRRPRAEETAMTALAKPAAALVEAQPQPKAPSIAELKAAFPGVERAAFRESCQERGLTLPEARQAFTELERDEAQAEATKLREELATRAKADEISRKSAGSAAPGAAHFGAVEVGEDRATIFTWDRKDVQRAFGGLTGRKDTDVDAKRAFDAFQAVDVDPVTGQAGRVPADVIKLMADHMTAVTKRKRPELLTSFAMGRSNPDYAAITVKGIIGTFYKSIGDEFDKSWAKDLMWLNTESNQETETYKWLGQVPQLREWLGGRRVRGPGVNSFAITNKTWEATLGFDIEDFRFDKTGQIRMRIGDLGRTVVDHWEARLTEQIVADGLCYDGQNFFDTDHPAADLAEGGGSNTSTYKNELTSTEVPALNVTTAADPTADEALKIVMGVISYARLYRDNENRPYNDGAKAWRFMTSQNLDGPFMGAIRDRLRNSGATNTVAEGNYRYASRMDIDVISNSRLTTTDIIYAFRVDSPMKPFIGQEPSSPEMTFLGEGSDHAFKHNQYLVGQKAVREVDYGQWAHAVKGTLS